MIYKVFRVPNTTKYRVDHVFDEEKSVRWNREEVERQNQAIDDERKAAYAARNAAIKELDEAVVKYITETTHLNEKLAEKVLYAVQRDHEDNWWNYVDDLADFTEAVIEAWKESMND
jgi:predicted  nucleic acid-binding Zn-ribbon protein